MIPVSVLHPRGGRIIGTTCWCLMKPFVSKTHMPPLPRLWQLSHTGRRPSHLIFRSRHGVHANAILRRLRRGFPPVATVAEEVCMSCTAGGPG